MSSSRHVQQPAKRHHSVPDNMPPENVEHRNGHPVLKCIEPKHPLSLSQVFEDSADPESIIQYARYMDEPQVKCRNCNASEKLSRIAFQNSCKKCRVKGLKIVFFLFFVFMIGSNPPDNSS